MPPTPIAPAPSRRIYVSTDSEQVAGAEVTAGSSCVDVHFHVRGGHVPAKVRADLVDTVFELPEVGPQRLLQASVPLGDAELLDALRRRCSSMDTRAAGATCLVDGVLAPGPAPPGRASLGPARG
jgi:hypothetical protein